MLQILLKGYEHADIVVAIARHGIEPRWHDIPNATDRTPRNHQSCKRHLRALTRSIREGQKAGQYLVLDADILNHWEKVYCSPLDQLKSPMLIQQLKFGLFMIYLFQEENQQTIFSTKSAAPVIQFEYVTVLAR